MATISVTVLSFGIYSIRDQYYVEWSQAKVAAASKLRGWESKKRILTLATYSQYILPEHNREEFLGDATEIYNSGIDSEQPSFDIWLCLFVHFATIFWAGLKFKLNPYLRKSQDPEAEREASE